MSRRTANGGAILSTHGVENFGQWWHGELAQVRNRVCAALLAENRRRLPSVSLAVANWYGVLQLDDPGLYIDV